MTCKVERYTEGPDAHRIKSMTFFCDHPGCDQHPNDLEIAAAGGLTKMGWECPGGKHFCPEHRSTPMLHDTVDKVVTIQRPPPVLNVRGLLVNAYVAGATAVHEHWQEDRDPDFTEAAHDYADDIINRKEET